MQPATASEPYGSLPPIDHIRSAADLYFRYCHNQPYSLFHESSLRHKIEVGEVPTHLLFALLASTVRYSSDPFFEDNKVMTDFKHHTSFANNLASLLQ